MKANDTVINKKDELKIEKSTEVKTDENEQKADELKTDTKDESENPNENEQKADEETKADEVITNEVVVNTEDTDIVDVAGSGIEKAVVRYIGTGIWKDENGLLWSKNDDGNVIKSERIIAKHDYDERKDIKFMVGYGAMAVTFVE